MNKTSRKGRVRGCLFLAALLLLSTAAAAPGNSPEALSASHLEAIRHNQSGIKAEARGEKPAGTGGIFRGSQD